MEVMTRVSPRVGWKYRLEQFGVGCEEGRMHEFHFGWGVGGAEQASGIQDGQLGWRHYGVAFLTGYWKVRFFYQVMFVDFEVTSGKNKPRVQVIKKVKEMA